MVEKPKFSNKHIDEINVDKSQNFFSSVWDDIKTKNITITNLLDVGCGNGLFTIYAKEIFSCSVTGVDGNTYALEQAKNNGFDEIHYIHDFDHDTFNLPNNHFDFVLCKDLMEHLISPEVVLGEIYRVTKPNGYVLLHVPNHFPIAGRLKFLLHNDIDTFNYFPDSKRWDFPHIRFFTYESLLEMSRLYGFELDTNLSYHFPLVPCGKIIPFKKKLASINPTNFAEGLTVLLKKQSIKEKE
jgi:SAM-dependent methyltransferase